MTHIGRRRRLAEDSHSLYEAKALDGIACQFFLVLPDIVHAYGSDVVDGFCQPGGGNIIGRASLEFKGWTLECGLVETHRGDHLATTHVRRKFVKPLFLTIEHADAGRTIDLMTGECQEIAV